MSSHQNILQMAEQLLAGQLTMESFLAAVARQQTAELPDTTLDLDRRRRCGYPEVIFGEGKSVPTLARIMHRLLEERSPVLATRIAADKAAELLREFPAGRYNDIARTFRIPLEGVL